jgi:hypothetical protein
MGAVRSLSVLTSERPKKNSNQEGVGRHDQRELPRTVHPDDALDRNRVVICSCDAGGGIAELCQTDRCCLRVRLVPVVQAADSNTRLELLKRIIALGRARAVLGPEAARSHDDLYDDEGMPG